MNNTAGPGFWRGGSLGSNRRARLLFAHVREDIDVEIALARTLPDPGEAMVITSGGCLAVALRTIFRGNVCSIDINPAQNYLAELKSLILEYTPALEQLRLYHTSDARPVFDQVQANLSESARTWWTQHRSILKYGLHRCGAIDRRLGGLRELFHLLIHSRGMVQSYLSLSSLDAQRQVYDCNWDTRFWRIALNAVFHPRLLRLILGSGIKVPESLPELFRQKFERLLTTFPAFRNRAAHELFLGTFPPDWEYSVPHLRQSIWEQLQKARSRVSFVTADVAEWLSNRRSNSLDLIALSNVLEMAPPTYGVQLLNSAKSALTPGGILVCRSILPWPENFAVGKLEELPAQELPRDQSGICNLVRVFRKSELNRLPFAIEPE